MYVTSWYCVLNHIISHDVMTVVNYILTRSDDGHQKQPQVKPIIEPVTRRRSETQQPPKTNRYQHIGIAVAIVILGVGLGYFLRSRFRTRL